MQKAKDTLKKRGGERGLLCSNTDLHILQRVLLSNTPQHVLFTALLQLAGENKLVQDVVGLGEGEDDIELAHVAVVLVHLLDIAVNDFEGDQFVVVGGAADNEEERGISTVDNLGVCQSQKRC